MRPKKRFGQNFLTNTNAAKRIVELLDASPDDLVVEIGGGRGDLTQHLVATGANIVVIELDRDLAPALQERFVDSANLRIMQSDILRVEARSLLGSRSDMKLIGNLPYNITSPIIEWIVENRRFIPRVVIMVQREVAQRIAAIRDSKDFGALTVFVQLFYAVRREFDLKPGSFFPAPKVSSSVLTLKRLERPLVSSAGFPALRRLTAASFRWRRKQMQRILRDEYLLTAETADAILQSCQIAPTCRPEQMAVEQFVRLSQELPCDKPSSASSSP